MNDTVFQIGLAFSDAQLSTSSQYIDLSIAFNDSRFLICLKHSHFISLKSSITRFQISKHNIQEALRNDNIFVLS